MKNRLICLIVAVAAVVCIMQAADAAVVKNVTSQRIVIRLSNGHSLELMPQYLTQVGDAQFSSPLLQARIQHGEIEVVTPPASSSSGASAPAQPAVSAAPVLTMDVPSDTLKVDEEMEIVVSVEDPDSDISRVTCVVKATGGGYAQTLVDERNIQNRNYLSALVLKLPEPGAYRICLEASDESTLKQKEVEVKVEGE